ncbi:AAA family ATPase [Streptomyces sp. AM 3-1-1]|uniref:AAA family ATPase n=1 Tax=Streptomyces sp. AM 3-1-1 TaxID=3028711 RepID=UPI0023B97CBC|nr:AAA family ATPase [Streptomyces sp. AM 3-1-1]WEH27293.1 AAA family ATPase [Streptomyces sp. AM 3-1-1]
MTPTDPAASPAPRSGSGTGSGTTAPEPTAALVERAEALALLAAETARARAGRGRLVLLRGATGTGRTALLDAVAAGAEGRGVRVLRARCAPDKDGEALGTVRQFLGRGPEGRPPFYGADAQAESDRCWEALRAYAERGPVLVTVDDVHHADGASRRWLVGAAERIDTLPVLVVVTERSQYDVELRPAGLTHRLPPDLVRTHTLAPLGQEAAEALVRAARPEAGAAWVADVVRAGARNPLLLHALLDDLAGLPAERVPVSCAALYPGAYAAAVAWWLESAGPATGRVARTLAALEETEAAGTRAERGGDARGPELLAGAAGTEAPRTAGWLTAMTHLGPLTGGPGAVRWAHPLLRDAVLAGWTDARRRLAHREAAEALLRRGDRAEPVARRLLHAGTVGAPWASRVLGDAATAALDDARLDDAAAFLRRALHEPLPDTLRRRLLTELGSLEYFFDAAADGIPRLVEAVRLPAPGHERVHAAIALGTALFGRGETRAGARVLRTAAAEEPDSAPARAARVALVQLSDRDLELRREMYDWLGEEAERCPAAVGPAGRALLLRYEVTAGVCSARDAVRRIRALLAEPAEPLAEPFLLGTLAAVAQWADELDEAERLVDRALLGRTFSVLHPMHHALHNIRTDLAAARGAWDWVLAASRSRSAALRQPGPANGDAHALIALVETGRTREAQHFAEGFDLREAPDSWELNRFLYARGLLRAASGETTAALHDFLECGRRQASRTVVSPVVTPWRSAAALCRFALGERDEAVALAEAELRLARVWGTPRPLGRALRVLGVVTGRLELLREAVELLRDSPADTELIEALLSYGRALRAAGDDAAGLPALREAAGRADQAGALRLRAEAETALGTKGPAGPAGASGAVLTAGEHRIARLASEGRTNSEIAAQLHLALRTVETHLTHAYRKLGIRRRGELTRALGRGVRG